MARSHQPCLWGIQDQINLNTPPPPLPPTPLVPPPLFPMHTPQLSLCPLLQLSTLYRKQISSYSTNPYYYPTHTLSSPPLLLKELPTEWCLSTPPKIARLYSSVCCLCAQQRVTVKWPKPSHPLLDLVYLVSAETHKGNLATCALRSATKQYLLALKVLNLSMISQRRCQRMTCQVMLNSQQCILDLYALLVEVVTISYCHKCILYLYSMDVIVGSLARISWWWMPCTCEDKSLRRNGKDGNMVIYVHADEGLSKRER